MIDELRHFLAVVELGTMTGAARQVNLSQPALTASIRRLERAVGGTLFHRGRNGARPTEAGRAFLPRARNAVNAFDEGRRAVSDVLGLNRGEVRIGAGATACTYLLPQYLAAFRHRHPRIRLMLRELSTDACRVALQSHEIDLGIVSSGEGEPWLRDPMVLVGAPGQQQEGTDTPFLTLQKGTGSRALLEQHFPGADVVMELGGIAAVKGHVRAGIGVALVSMEAVRADVEQGRMRIVNDARTPVHRTMRLIHNGEDRLSPAASALRNLLLAGPPENTDP